MRIPCIRLICDRCGKEIIIDQNDKELAMNVKNQQIVNIIIPRREYGSRYDGCVIGFDICEDCLEEWFSTFKHYPVTCPESG